MDYWKAPKYRSNVKKWSRFEMKFYNEPMIVLYSRSVFTRMVQYNTENSVHMHIDVSF